MKRIVALLVLMVAVTAHASPVWVAVKSTVIRKAATNLSPVVSKLSYQDELDLVSEQGDWWQVSFQGKQGWVHKSALSKTLEKPAESNQKSSGSSFFSAFTGSSSSQSKHSGSRERGGDADDITLAGKGFNQDVEGEFKSQGSDLNYAAVDVMENRKVSGFNFEKFAKQGGLNYEIEQAKAQPVSEPGPSKKPKSSKDIFE